MLCSSTLQAILKMKYVEDELQPKKAKEAARKAHEAAEEAAKQAAAGHSAVAEGQDGTSAGAPSRGVSFALASETMRADLLKKRQSSSTLLAVVSDVTDDMGRPSQRAGRDSKESSEVTREKEEDNKTKLLTLAVNWDRDELLQDLLSKDTSDKEMEATKKATPAERAMQRAFEQCRVKIVSNLIEFGGGGHTGAQRMCKRIMIAKLYTICVEGDDDDHRVCKTNKALSTFLIEHDAEVRDHRLSATDQYKLYKKFIVPFFHSISWMLSEQVAEAGRIRPADLSGEGAEAGRIRPADVFFWACLMGSKHNELADLIWHKTQKPVHTALLGALLCRNVGRKITGHAKKKMDERAEELEKRAIDLLEEATDAEAQEIVSLKLVQGQQYQILDLALHAKMKDFLESRHCVRFMDHEWRGSFEGNTYELRGELGWFNTAKELVFYVVFPFWLIELRGGKKRQRVVTSTSMTLQARAQVGALAAEQRKLAIDSVKADRAKRGVEYEPKDASHDSHLGDGTAAKARKTSPKLKTSSSRERIELVASQSRSKALSIFSRRSSGGGADVGSKVAAKGFGTSEVSTKRSVVARMPGGQLKARTPKDMSEGLSGAAVEMFEASASADDSVIDAVDELGQQVSASTGAAIDMSFAAALMSAGCLLLMPFMDAFCGCPSGCLQRMPPVNAPCGCLL